MDVSDSASKDILVYVIYLTVWLKGMAPDTWAYKRAPLNLQWLVLKNGGTDFGLLILCSKKVLGL